MVRDGDKVVEVAADFIARDEEAGEVPAGNVRRLLGDKMPLDSTGKAELATHTLGCQGLGVEAGIDNGGGGLGGNGLGKGDIRFRKLARTFAIQTEDTNTLVAEDKADTETADDTLADNVIVVAAKVGVVAHVLHDYYFIMQGADIQFALAGRDGSFINIGVTKAEGGL